MKASLHVDEDRGRAAFVDRLLKRKGYTADRLATLAEGIRAAPLDEAPDKLRFDKQRTYKGRTVNISALCDDPADQAWLTDFLYGGRDSAESDEEASEDAGQDATVSEDGAEGETPDAGPADEQEELVDDAPALRQAFAQMPRSLMRKEFGLMLPDWQRILAGVKGQSRKQLEERCLVAEKRFRDSMTRDAIIQEATAGLRGRNAIKLRNEKHHAIWASWRWLDRPANQAKIADTIRRARDTKPAISERKPTIKAPASVGAVSVLLAKADQRRRARKEAMLQDTGTPSIMIESRDDCHDYGPGFHRVPGFTPVETRARLAPPLPPVMQTVAHTCPKCQRAMCPICKRPLIQVRTKLRHLAVEVLK